MTAAALTPGTYWTGVALLAAMVLILAGGLFLDWLAGERKNTGPRDRRG